MAKIMLVEDDNNLREIYEARLLAEGYEIVSAKDGEEALALAVKEKPDLIISDVMMPKISGFDMLDILRSTAETKDTKVIMMTALSQAEDKARADKLGADRYLVKSQVTLEDVAKVAHDVLNGDAADTPLSVVPPALPTAPPTTTDQTAVPVADPAVAVAPVTPDPVAATTEEPNVPPTPPSIPVVEPDSEQSIPEPASPATSDQTVATEPEPAVETPVESAVTPEAVETIKEELSQTTAAEEQIVESQIDAALNQVQAADPGVIAPVEETPIAEAPSEAVAETSTAPSEENSDEIMPDSTAPQEPIVVAPEPAATPPATEEVAPESVTEAPAEPAPEPSVAPAPLNDPTGGTKRVIQPISDFKAPDINQLLQKEQETPGVAPTPANAVFTPTQGQPEIAASTPGDEATEQPVKPAEPGNTIQPNDIAL